MIQQYRWDNRLSKVTPIKRRRSIPDRVGEFCFSWLHRTNLIYTTCWEDPRLDREAMSLTENDTVLVITSAGCNALDYAITGTKHVYAVDMNPHQNALLELKLAGIRELDFESFFDLFGKGRLHNVREIYEKQLRQWLSGWSVKYWDRHCVRFFDRKRSFYFRGTAGNFARVINYYINQVVKLRDAFDALLAAPTLEAQQEIYHRDIGETFWNEFLLKFVGNDVTLWMLGVPNQQRQQVERYYPGGISTFIRDCCETVFTQLPIKDNYFWRVCLTGQYASDCCPEYLKEENFLALKKGLVDRISTHTTTVEGFLRKHDEPISRFVLLDHMDWLSTHREKELESEWQAIIDRAAPNTRVLFRSGGMKVEYVDPILVSYEGKSRPLGELLTYNHELAQRLHKLDRVHTYGSFYIADFNR